MPSIDKPLVEFFACGHARVREDMQHWVYRQELAEYGEVINFPSSCTLFSIDQAPINLIDALQLFSNTACPLETCQMLYINGTDDVVILPAVASFNDLQKTETIERLLSQYEFSIVDLVYSLNSLAPEIVEAALCCVNRLGHFAALDKLFDVQQGRVAAIKLDAAGIDDVRNVLTRLDYSSLTYNPPFMIDALYLIAKQHLGKLRSGLWELENFVHHLMSIHVDPHGKLCFAADSMTEDDDDEYIQWINPFANQSLPSFRTRQILDDDLYSPFDGRPGLSKMPAEYVKDVEEYNPFLSPPRPTESVEDDEYMSENYESLHLDNDNGAYPSSADVQVYLANYDDPQQSKAPLTTPPGYQPATQRMTIPGMADVFVGNHGYGAQAETSEEEEGPCKVPHFGLDNFMFNFTFKHEISDASRVLHHQLQDFRNENNTQAFFDNLEDEMINFYMELKTFLTTE